MQVTQNLRCTGNNPAKKLSELTDYELTIRERKTKTSVYSVLGAYAGLVLVSAALAVINADQVFSLAGILALLPIFTQEYQRLKDVRAEIRRRNLKG